MAARRSLSGGYSMTRNTEPPFGGGRRWPRAMASSLPRLSAGVRVVSHSSCTMALPLVRLKTCGDGPFSMKLDRPAASWPVTTRRMDFVIRASLPAAFERARLVDEFEWSEFIGDIGR